MPMSRQVSAQRGQQAVWPLNGTPIGYRTEWGGIGGNGPVRGGLRQPRGPAVTAGASSMPGTLPVGLICRFPAARRRGKVGVRLQRQPDHQGEGS